jgi:hypothetical protein
VGWPSLRILASTAKTCSSNSTALPTCPSARYAIASSRCDASRFGALPLTPSLSLRPRALTAYSQSATVASSTAMTNHFYHKCGTLMYRVSQRFSGWSILRVGAVDDFGLRETRLRPWLSMAPSRSRLSGQGRRARQINHTVLYAKIEYMMRFRLQWIPGYSGIRGNNAANKPPKKAVNPPTAHDPHNPAPPREAHNRLATCRQ